jgi:hypothetical protein
MSLASPSALSVLGITGRDTALGDSANYYTMTTPTPGTGIITNAGTSAVATTPSLVLFNTGLLNIYLMYLRLSSTVVGGGAATKNFTHYLDAGNRYASGGTALVSQNTNMSSNSKSSLAGYTGAITATAASPNQRTLGNDWFRVALADVVGDVYEWQFGAPFGSAGASTPATVCTFVRSAPAIVIQPQNCYLLNLWSSTFTQGITFEITIGYAEK